MLSFCVSISLLYFACRFFLYFYECGMLYELYVYIQLNKITVIITALQELYLYYISFLFHFGSNFAETVSYTCYNDSISPL